MDSGKDNFRNLLQYLLLMWHSKAQSPICYEEIKMKVFSIIVGLFSFTLTAFLALSYINPAVASPDPVLYEKVQQAQPDFLEKLETLVNIDSGTGDQDGLTKVEDLIIEYLKSIGATVQTVSATPSIGRNIIATVQGTGRGKKILLLAHTDTVFKEGTVAERPFRVTDGKAYGPGVMDDKGGILLGFEALKILKGIDFKNFETITFLINPDEERGSFGSRDLIKETAAAHDVAFVLEFGSPDDKVTSWRKGIGYYGFEVRGRAAHAGAEPEKGCNALIEASHQALQLKDTGNLRKQTTVNFTVFQAGERPNIIPDFAKVQADVRVLDAQEYDRLEQDFNRIAQNKLLPCTEVTILAERGRPPFPPNSQTDTLVKKAQAIYRELGFSLGVEGSGGGTDGNYAASVGTATLDALGPVGGGAHSADEYINLDRIAPRMYLLAKMIMEL
ncbi:MAG: M20/M25/M40 family metallo-hydrolase [Drouetiella hepatica Uher 2000/2452]|uniref:M20/M25/M40 family metallo-hydrolase n=1 Tax=Drouetiella hepatica Uher 2000/2452 TaxID=904376 RepID=A0A951QGI6_9CYAN|nr:M20/M25/M40 family metallo-hydrolase [Drouetiella hepatica Uher 2000/2452]